MHAAIQPLQLLLSATARALSTVKMASAPRWLPKHMWDRAGEADD